MSERYDALIQPASEPTWRREGNDEQGTYVWSDEQGQLGDRLNAAQRKATEESSCPHTPRNGRDTGKDSTQSKLQSQEVGSDEPEDHRATGAPTTGKSIEESMTASNSPTWSTFHAKQGQERLLESRVRGNVQALFGGEELGFSSH